MRMLVKSIKNIEKWTLVLPYMIAAVSDINNENAWNGSCRLVEITSEYPSNHTLIPSEARKCIA